MRSSRTAWSYVYLLFCAAAVVGLNVVAWPYTSSHPDSATEVLFLVAAAAVMNLAEVRIDRGRLTLAALVTGAAAILVNPLDATIVGMASAAGLINRPRWSILANAIMFSAVVCVGAVVASKLRVAGQLGVGPRVLILVVQNSTNLVLVTVGLSIQSGESVATIVRQNFTRSFLAAFAYFALASLLISYVIDGSLLGYFLAGIVCVLALALTDTIAGRRVRRVLESELSDADRHLFHSRAVEGVVHNLRNHMANALGYLREIDSRKLDQVDRESLATATDAANDAVTVLRGLAQGATPRVSYSPDPVDLNELASRAAGMARPRARGKEVQLAIRESPDRVTVHADPLLMREVITNLVNNAIDAAPQGGRVELVVGRRGSGWPYLSVSDNGDGVSEENRHRLFEPHFTTKEAGTGLGLFMSYGIVREHQGELLYEGNRHGAVFIVALPPFSG